MAQPRTNLVSHVSDKGIETVEIIVHTAANIPFVENNIPFCFVTGQSKLSMNSKDEVEKPNATVPIEGQFPVWNDILFVETLEENALNEELYILLIDESYNKNIAEFRIPWDWLTPFYQYHLELNMNLGRKTPETLKLYVSLTRKTSALAQKEFKYYGLEMLLTHFDNPISQKLSLYAVARIVPNYLNYKNTFLKSAESSLMFNSIYFPSPAKNNFKAASFSMEGRPQVTLATRASSIPIWNHSFMFTSKEEKDAMFNEKLDPAIVIEFFTFSKYNKMWSIKNLLGWCKIKLDQRCGNQLQEDITMGGLRTEDMLIETDGSLVGQASKYLTAETVLRMVPEKCPKKTLNSETPGSLPILDSYYYEDEIRKNIEPVYLQSKFKSKNNNDPIKVNPTPRVVHSPRPNEIVPKVVHSARRNEIISTPRQNGNFLNYLKPNITDFSNVKIRDPDRLLLFQRDDFSEIPIDYRYAFLSYQQPNSTDLEGWVGYYTNLLNAYKALVKKMNEDIVLYRQQLRNLELSNNQLTSKMNNFEDKKQALLKLAEINETDKAKLNQSFIEMKTRISIKTNENVVLKDQVDRLRRELERRKEAEAEMKKMILVQSSLNNELDLMRQRLAKAYGLEDTVRRQEIVIEKLEAYVKRLNRQRRADARGSNYFNINNDDFSLEI